MRVLWVKPGGLWPLTTGGRLRSFHILEELASRHALTLLTTHARADDPIGLAGQLRGCEVLSVPHAPAKRDNPGFAWALARSWLSRLPVDLLRWRCAALRTEVEARLRAGQADVCVADFLAALPNLPLRAAAPVVLFEHNVEHAIWRRLAQVERGRWRRALLEIEWRKLRRFEAEACGRVALTLAVSEADAAVLAGLTPGARLAAIPTGVDTGYFHPSGAPRQAGLVFSGSMDWYPNEDAMLYFLEAIQPHVRREIPDARLTVVGRNPSDRLRAVAEAAGARVTGTVADVRPFLDEACVYVVPLRVGGGTRLKIFEALAMGKAVVSTSVGAEGLPVEAGRHFVRADDPLSFAQAVVALLRDPERRAALGQAGRRLVFERHSWTQVARDFEARLQEVVACA